MEDHLAPPKQSANEVRKAFGMLQARPNGTDINMSMKNMEKSRSGLLVVAHQRSVDEQSVVMKPTSAAEVQSHSEHSEFMQSIKRPNGAAKMTVIETINDQL